MINLIPQFKLALSENTDAIRYLLNRKVSGAAIKEFQIGFCPTEYKKSYKGCDISWLAGRIVFPMFDAYGELIAYAGRGMNGEKPKYINTEYSKSNNFYNLEKAKKFILEHDYAILVEGQVDVITAYMNGLKNTVGLCGTVFGQERISLLARYTDNIVIVPDSDIAGLNCANKIKDLLNRYGFNVDIVKCQPHKDIDEILNSDDKLDFIERLNNRVNTHSLDILNKQLERLI